jgi:hypothetical protein
MLEIADFASVSRPHELSTLSTKKYKLSNLDIHAPKKAILIIVSSVLDNVVAVAD